MTSPVLWPSPERHALFEAWLQRITAAHGLQPQTLQLASADASFRRYLRLQSNCGPLVVMDAPPPLEDVRPFVHVAQLMQQAGLPSPQVLQADLDNGFLLLTDLGNEQVLAALLAAQARQAQVKVPVGQLPPSSADAHALMMQALTTLVQFQLNVPASKLPPFDAKLLQAELDLFPTWCVQKEFGQVWTEAQQRSWQDLCERLIQNNLQQGQVAVHADYMPRNLMVLSGGLGILDFQDAVSGPITYDTASLLRDAFISWTEEEELDWAIRGWQLQRAAKLPVQPDFADHWQQLEWTGLQRHLKVLGIFCRLKHRDGKPHYAQDLPRFMHYATRVAMRYGPLRPLLPLLEPLSGTKLTHGFTF